MRIVNTVLVVAALLAVAGGYLQEKRRLAKVQQLPVAEARALCEAQQLRRERVLMAVTAALLAGAAAAVIARLASS